MRKLSILALCLVPGVALGRGSITVGGGARGGSRGGTRVRAGGGGLSVHYTKRSSNSSLSFRFSGGSAGFRSSRYGYGYPGGASWWGTTGGAVRKGHRPHPSHPYHRVYRPYHRYGCGPYGYGTSVYFVGTPGVQVFPVPGTVPAAVPPAVPGIDPSKYAHLTADQAVDVGDALFAQGDYGEAVAAYRAAVQKAPNDPMAVFALGHGLFAIGVLDEAAATLRRGVTLHPEIVRAQMRRRDFYGKPADYDDQMAQLLRYAATHPGDKNATFLLGYNFFYSQEPALAKAQFAQLGADDAVARLFLAVLTPGD